MKEIPSIETDVQTQLEHMTHAMVKDSRPTQEELAKALIENLEDRFIGKLNLLILLMTVLGVVGILIFTGYGIAKLKAVLKEEISRSADSILRGKVSTHDFNKPLLATIEQRVLQVLDRAEENNYSIEEAALAIQNSLHIFTTDIAYATSLDAILPKPHYIRVWFETPTEPVPRLDPA